jgi:hypothetical protein
MPNRDLLAAGANPNGVGVGDDGCGWDGRRGSNSFGALNLLRAVFYGEREVAEPILDGQTTKNRVRLHSVPVRH